MLRTCYSLHSSAVLTCSISTMSLYDVCMSALSLWPDFSDPYIILTREPRIVLLTQAGFSKCGRMGGGSNHTVYSLFNKPAVYHPSHHWSHPLSGPLVLSTPPPFLVFLASHATVLTGISVIFGWKIVLTRKSSMPGKAVLDPNTDQRSDNSFG